ncbi:phospholipid carrier-dependent glycosyltransferase [Candidatus Parcubacteria bacterium]|nr:MAG: phospholipid carrier-dependent glycosyltransferase [Candidatus Parcubacteria bacterium]
MKKKYILLSLIFALALVLRFYRLGEAPISLHRDEAFLGYNAYSILKTGKDISGNFLPLHLQSFLYSPAGYSYFSIPFIYLFDLSSFSVRFASAFFGSLTILLTYFLTKEIFFQNRLSQIKKHINTDRLALLASLLLAISPWHINLSRTATENTIVVFFIALGILLFLYWIKNNKLILLISSFVFFGSTFLIYQAPRAFLPLLLPLLILIFIKPSWNKKFIMLLSLFIFTIIIPLFLVLNSENLSLRLKSVSFFSSLEKKEVIYEYAARDNLEQVPILITRSIHNKPTEYSSQFLRNYFNHFSYEFLFTDSGFPGRYRIPSAGLVYLMELPFLILGIWYLMNYKKKEGLLLLGWIALVPIGSSLTFDDIPNLQRTLIVFPAFSIVGACGILYLFNIFPKKKPLYILTITFILTFIGYGFLSYLHQYYVHAPAYRPWFRQDGYEELVTRVNKYLPNYEKAIVTNRESAPTIFFLFFSKYDPSSFQEETKNTNMKDFDRIGFGKYIFSQEECPLKEAGSDTKKLINADKNTLYVNSSLCPPLSTGITDIIKRSDDSKVFQILSLRE